jgi:hypothetical protein
MSDDAKDRDIEWAREAAEHMGMGRKSDVVALLRAQAVEAERCQCSMCRARSAELRRKAEEFKDKKP